MGNKKKIPGCYDIIVDEKKELNDTEDVRKHQRIYIYFVPFNKFFTAETRYLGGYMKEIR